MRALLLFSLVFLSAADASFAQSSGAPSAPSDAEQPPADGDPTVRPRPKLGIDSLLRPRTVTAPRAPASAPPTEETYGGRTREAWVTAFTDARTELREAEASLEKSRKKLAEASQTGGYTYNPLGGTGADSSPTDPEVQKAKAQRDRDRKAIEAAQKRLRDLSVEASLAGVPDAWIPPDPDASRSAPKSEPEPADPSRAE
jgi:hypothetical protein